jgi:hypothetical protein
VTSRYNIQSNAVCLFVYMITWSALSRHRFDIFTKVPGLGPVVEHGFHFVTWVPIWQANELHCLERFLTFARLAVWGVCFGDSSCRVKYAFGKANISIRVLAKIIRFVLGLPCTDLFDLSVPLIAIDLTLFARHDLIAPDLIILSHCIYSLTLLVFMFIRDSVDVDLFATVGARPGIVAWPPGVNKSFWFVVHVMALQTEYMWSMYVG